ncbi:ArsR/SmtB family transcription factor [Natranaeroarchaeum aerophilus]|uniref:Metalloregulator ArsR/SmtB family transcription factor n=1 Tax=Natranaeroarchaeum aerophilus TaxID=2917711 RepID=A0AAE3FRJ5_9EURY|nr:metalloregulator ArsR/SmtB family transcription factor [Natranaeroarchaeum aerophilus]MCL9814277.1 metalloregulator ArsR/SmtB family transcription factor [Natranaeroarchaeum aerophilus]
MDSAALLDLLGNENRRRILRLLAHKPCYVTEISEYLDVSPKAVIDHLRKLEEAGIIESRTDSQRRKYFHISRNLRLEVNVSPYEFGTKSAYPRNRALDVTTWRYLSLDIHASRDGDDSQSLAAELRELERLENELSMAQRWVQGRLTDVLDRLTDELEATENSRLYADVLLELAERPRGTDAISDAVDAPPGMVEQVLAEMAEEGLVSRVEDGWTLVE